MYLYSSPYNRSRQQKRTALSATCPRPDPRMIVSLLGDVGNYDKSLKTGYDRAYEFLERKCYILDSVVVTDRLFCSTLNLVRVGGRRDV